jgi:hypothetical protein
MMFSFPPKQVFTDYFRILALFMCFSSLSKLHNCISPPLDAFLHSKHACFLWHLLTVRTDPFSIFALSNEISHQSSAAPSVETCQLSHQVFSKHPRFTPVEQDVQHCCPVFVCRHCCIRLQHEQAAALQTRVSFPFLAFSSASFSSLQQRRLKIKARGGMRHTGNYGFHRGDSTANFNVFLVQFPMFFSEPIVNRKL